MYDDEREWVRIDELNAELETMPLSELGIRENFKNRLTKETTVRYRRPAGKLLRRLKWLTKYIGHTEYVYWLDRKEIVCLQEEGKPRYIWQFGVEILPLDRVRNGKAYYRRWKSLYPDRVMGVWWQASFEDKDVYVVAYHEA